MVGRIVCQFINNLAQANQNMTGHVFELKNFQIVEVKE